MNNNPTHVKMGILLFVVFAIFISAFLVYVTLTDLNTKVKTLESSLADSEIRMANLQLMVGENGKLLSLEKELINISKNNKKNGLGDLGIDLPNVAHKILSLSERYKDDGLETSLILALVEVESRFDPRATSTYVDTGGSTKPLAYGLTQMIRSTATKYAEDLGYSWSPEIMYDPVLSLEMGITHLVDLHRQYMSEGLEFRNEWSWSIQSYLWGERPVKQAMKSNIYSKESPSLGYWKKVRDAQIEWKKRGF